MNNQQQSAEVTKLPKSESERFRTQLQNYLPSSYVYEKASNRIVYQEWKRKGEREYLEETPVCSPLAVTALTHSEDCKEGGLRLQWIDRGNKLRTWVFPQSILAEDFKTLAKSLQNQRIEYLPVEQKARRLLMDYLQLSLPEKNILYTEKTGWHDGSFVFPDFIVGEKEIVFQATSSHHKPPKIVGDIETWNDKLGKYCVGNPTLMLGACCGFASPLAGLLGESGFLCHLVGASSRGKTLSIGMQCSIFGMNKGSWRGTDNSKEGEFEARNHIGTSLDELGQSTIKDAFQIVYMLGNGQGKGRANKDGTQQRIRTFNVIALSTGELTLDDFLSHADKQITGGLSVRFIQAVSDKFKYGCFDHIHDFNSSREFAEYLKKTTGISGDEYRPEASGTVGIKFIEYLAENVGNDYKRMAAIQAMIEKVALSLTPENADNQISRMANSIALLIVAGKLAVKAGLADWSEDAPYKELARWWYECVLPTRGGSKSTEEEKATEQIKDWFELNHMSHFTPLPSVGHEQPCNNSGKHYGYVDILNGEAAYYVTAAGWKQICKGVNQKLATQACIEKGWLTPYKDGTPQAPKKVQGKTGRYYTLNNSIFD